MSLYGVFWDLWPEEKDMGYVYFAQMHRVGPIKIGFARNVKKRIGHLQTHSPFEIVLIHKTPSTVKEEKQVHEKFSKWRIRGEWFHPSDEIFDYIKMCVKKDIKYKAHRTVEEVVEFDRQIENRRQNGRLV